MKRMKRENRKEVINMKCSFCGFEAPKEDFEEDFKNHKGAWCPVCDGFTFFAGEQPRNNFKLLLESASPKSCATEYIPVPFATQVSPLRWPGGKSKFVGKVLEQCDNDMMENFVEPFAGGASVGLALLLAGKCKELYLNDIDFGIASLFEIIKTAPDTLIERIRTFQPSESAYKKAQAVIKSGYKDVSPLDAAWNLLVVNRLAFSGIPRANCMKDPMARWNPKTLIKRISRICRVSEHIHISCMDACAYIEEMYWLPHTTIFIDPPYREKGKLLYMNFYRDDDHERLSILLDELFKNFPGSDILITYDDCEYIRELYEFPVQEEISRVYSIAN